MSLGIFGKPCPACAVVVPRDATSCDCGHAFANGEEAGAPTLAQEELFESYLSARVQQALADMETARAELAAAPQDTDKAYALLRQVETLHAQRDEWRAQQTKVAALQLQKPAAADTGTARFRAAQAARAAQAVANGAGPRACPACGAAWPPSSSRCGCGLPIASALLEVAEETPAPIRK